VDGEEEGAIELLVVGAVAALHPAVVPLAAEGVTLQVALERAQEAFHELGDAGGVGASELLSPVGLKDDGGFDPMGAQPQEDEEEEGDPVGAVEAMAVGQETEAGAPLAGRPLVTGEVVAAQMGGVGRAQGLLIADILDVDLDEGEGGLALPGPGGGIEDTALATARGEGMAGEDVADGVRGEVQAPLVEEGRQALAPILGLLTGLEDLGLEVCRDLTRAVMGAMRAVAQPLLPLGRIAPHPEAHHLARGVPAVGRSPHAARLLIGLHQEPSCRYRIDLV